MSSERPPDTLEAAAAARVGTWVEWFHIFPFRPPYRRAPPSCELHTRRRKGIRYHSSPVGTYHSQANRRTRFM